MDYNFHTHTTYSNHAHGTPREYIERSIACGIKELGFSDHLSFAADDGRESYWRIPKSDVKNYCEDILLLKAEYQDRIQIHLGFEMEYYPNDFETMLRTAKDWGAEYLILGQHFLGNEYKGYPYSGNSFSQAKDLRTYTDLLIDAMKSGAFTYVAHPDIFHFQGESEYYRQEVLRLCHTGEETGVPLEINFLGIRSGRHYPTNSFWEIVGETQAPVAFGFDAHDTAAAYDEASLSVANAMVAKYNLNYIGKPVLRKL